MSNNVRIAPSILAADYLQLASELKSVASADLLHVDVMDGHYVPPISFGADVVRALASGTDVPLDVHLMVSNPDECVSEYLDCGASYVTFHWEAATHAHRIVSQIHASGARAGIALNPATPPSVLASIMGEVDLVLVMSVDPGFGGQAFIPSSLHKLRALQTLCDEQGVTPLIEVDGGVSSSNAARIVAAGANVLVAGSSIFGEDDRSAAIDALRQAVCR